MRGVGDGLGALSTAESEFSENCFSVCRQAFTPSPQPSSLEPNMKMQNTEKLLAADVDTFLFIFLSHQG